MKMKRKIIPHKCNRCSTVLWFDDSERNYIYDNNIAFVFKYLGTAPYTFGSLQFKNETRIPICR